MSSKNILTVVPVILCGGSGTRLWPWSRETFPKQFIKMLGEHSMLQDTVARSKRITGVSDGRIVTVTLDDLRSTVVDQLCGMGQYAADHVLSEPSARNTAAAIVYAALYVRSVFGEDAYMWVLPADHHMGHEESLKTAFENGLKAAAEGYLVTFGIQPTRPETGYGYINLGDALIDDSVYRGNGFYEKPDKETAASYMQSGTFLWNSGMFLFRVDAVLKEFGKYAPAILDGARDAMEKGFPTLPDSELYSDIDKQPFDKAIMEKTDLVAVVPCDPDWSDVGSWESLWELKERDQHGNAIDGRVAFYDTKNCLVLGDGKRLVACAGVKDLVIVDTGDVLLITQRTNADDLKGLVGKMKEDGSPEVFSHTHKNDS